jgi:hypothetical protein
MRRITIAILMGVLACVIIGCSSGSKDALSVAKEFWAALEDQNLEKAKSYATIETRNSLQLNEREENEDVEIEFGEVTVEDSQTRVQTTMRSIGEESETTIPLETVLVKEEGEWRVDVDQTMMSLFGGAMGRMMEGLGEAMKDGMEDMGKAMVEGMKGAMEEMEEEMSKSADD